jgi:hypothetical protein
LPKLRFVERAEKREEEKEKSTYYPIPRRYPGPSCRGRRRSRSRRWRWPGPWVHTTATSWPAGCHTSAALAACCRACSSCRASSSRRSTRPGTARPAARGPRTPGSWRMFGYRPIHLQISAPRRAAIGQQVLKQMFYITLTSGERNMSDVLATREQGNKGTREHGMQRLSQRTYIIQTSIPVRGSRRRRPSCR